jgi:hypothetical protein
MWNQGFVPDADCCDHLFYRSMAYNLPVVTRPDLDVAPPGNRLPSVYTSAYYSRWMDARNGLARQPPYVYRVMTPLLARGLARIAFDGDVTPAFYLIAVASIGLTLIMTALAAHAASGSVVLALLAMGVIALAWPFQFSLWDFMLPDALSFGLISLGVYLLIRRQKVAFLAVCAVGVLTKEIVLLLLPAYAILEGLEGRWRLNTFVASVVIGAAYLGVRSLIEIPFNNYGPSTTFTGFTIGALQGVVASCATLFGLLIARVPLGAWRSPVALALLPLAVGSLLATLFITNTDRATIYAFPFVIVAACWLGRGDPHGLRSFTIVALAATLCLEGFARAGGQFPQRVLLVLIACGLAAEFWLWWRRARPGALSWIEA